MKTYSAWTGSVEKAVSVVEGTDRPKGLNGSYNPWADVLLWTIHAETFEEALAIHHLRMGDGDYRPIGEPKRCPICEA